ncbi:hypothetical protein [Streptomyces zhihengii]|nr:hypothetical protein [Streptomyces zhihengii]
MGQDDSEDPRRRHLPAHSPAAPAGGAVPTASDSLDWLKERLYL